MRIKYEPHPSPYMTDIMVGRITDTVEGVAREVAAKAAAIAPVDTGEYRDSIGYELEVTQYAHGPHRTATVYAAAEHAVEVEIRHATMTKAMGR